MFPDPAKIANVRPIYKKDKKEETKNYWPISVLSSFSKSYEKFIQESITRFVNKFLSKFILAYRKAYGTNHVTAYNKQRDFKPKYSTDKLYCI